jgi:hypothetical protein
MLMKKIILGIRLVSEPVSEGSAVNLNKGAMVREPNFKYSLLTDVLSKWKSIYKPLDE